MPTKSWIRSNFSKVFFSIVVALVSLAAAIGIWMSSFLNSSYSFFAPAPEQLSIREPLADIRQMLQKSLIEIQLAPQVRPEHAKSHVRDIASTILEMKKNVEALCEKSRNADLEKTKALRTLCDEFLVADEVEFAALQSGIQSSGGASPAVLEDLLKVQGKKIAILLRMEQFAQAQSQRAVQAKVQQFLFILVPVLIAIFLIPFSILMASSKKLKRGSSVHIRSLNELSRKNEKSSERLRTASELMSTASAQQSAAIQQTSSSIVQIRTMLSETEKRVREVQEIGTEMDGEAGGGREIMHKMEMSMLAIEETNKQIQSFEEILNQIESKTKVINDIVFKTQLLSFNASIEAARAGQYGRGFSVVAEEVGKLAMLSGDAATEIDQLLAQSADRVSKIVGSVTEKVREGKVVSQDAFVRFGDLANRAKLISVKVDQVANATIEQSGGIDQTVRAMEQVKIAAIENKKAADEVHQIADSVFGLSTQILEVTQAMNRASSEGKAGREPKDRIDDQDRSNDVSARKGDRAGESKAAKAESSGASSEKNLPTEGEKNLELGALVTLQKSQRTPAKVVSVSSRRSTEQVSADDPSFKKVEN